MIEMKNVTKDFKGNVVLKNINLTINDGELTVLIGPSGCGKTTTLKMINRLIPASKGDIIVQGKNIKNVNPVELKRNIGYVIQSGGLFPHMTIQENIEIIPKLEGKDETEMLKRTRELMHMVDLDPNEYLSRYPNELSGGQQQRIGVIRAMANDPDIILFDEPFSALDPVTRTSLQEELVELQSKVGKTMVFVTHDMDEALKIADRICIMKDGDIIQYDKPEVILKNPANDFVSDFVGANRIWNAPEYIKVKDFMIKSPVTCKLDLPRNKCVEKMREHHVDSLIVVNDRHHLEGMISRRALFRSKPDTTARNIMEKVQYTVQPEDNIIEVLQTVEESDANNFPVVDENNNLIGLLTNSSLVSTLSEKFLSDEGGEA